VFAPVLPAFPAPWPGPPPPRTGTDS
jgi:hypothetical protein